MTCRIIDSFSRLEFVLILNNGATNRRDQSGAFGEGNLQRTRFVTLRLRRIFQLNILQVAQLMWIRVIRRSTDMKRLWISR